MKRLNSASYSSESTIVGRIEMFEPVAEIEVSLDEIPADGN